MHKLSKAQMERRKKKRERNKPIRHHWRMYLQHFVRMYNRKEKSHG